jgi:hypothetical protein
MGILLQFNINPAWQRNIKDMQIHAHKYSPNLLNHWYAYCFFFSQLNGLNSNG